MNPVFREGGSGPGQERSDEQVQNRFQGFGKPKASGPAETPRETSKNVRAVVLCLLGALVASCGDDGLGPVSVNLDGPPPAQLSATNLLVWDGTAFTYNDRVVPYDLNTELFSDFALKDRAVYVPDGSSATYADNGVFDFPVGTVLVKTFSFPADFRAPTENITLVETRLLIRTAGGWQAWPYIWNEAQTDATLSPSGEVRTVTFLDAEGATQTSNYLIPQRNQCQSCHELKDEADDTFITPIGPSARNLHRSLDGVNQLTAWTDAGILTGLPAVDSIEAATDFRPIAQDGIAGLDAAQIEAAARDYLDVNCAHCHNPRGVQGITSQLFLNHSNDDEFSLGVCKRPGSAGAGTGGFDHDIVPGNPDESILIFRVETTEVGAMMPLLGRSLAHDRAVELLRAWVGNMTPLVCD